MQWKRGEKKNLTETLARSLLWKVRVAWMEKMSGKVEEGEELIVILCQAKKTMIVMIVLVQ